MSSALPSPDKSAPGTSETQTPPSTTPPSFVDGGKIKRVLACTLCHQRKIRCERKFPCSNCVRSGVQCVPATDHPRQRRRRFPERALLDRLRKYENLLRQNNVNFEPLHKDQSATRDLLIGAGACDSDDDLLEVFGMKKASAPSTPTSVTLPTAKDFWHAMDKVFQDSEGQNIVPENNHREAAAKEAWEKLYKDNDHLLIGSRKTAIDLSTLQPQPAQIFRLWQIYLENVNPLLKVTHTPTLQPRVIQAISDVAKIDTQLEALMFSIYCMSILSLPETDCESLFGFSKDYLLARYQFACQQALLNSGYLRSGDLECLTALYLYLVSVSLNTDPRSLSSMLGIALRIAKRMGIHSEAVNAKFTVLEAESRRRLWWSLVLFDTRIGEKADHKSTDLTPAWDCSLPLNVYDSDLWPEMKEIPAMEPKSTEAAFAVVRYEIANFVRHAPFYLDFSSPALKPIAKNSPISEGSSVIAMEHTLEDKYLKHCDPENPIHFMAIWTARGQLAKMKLVEHYSRYLSSPTKQSESQSDTLISYAFQMLQSDTKIMASPLTKGYHWLLRIYFPLPAYIHILQDLTRRPFSKFAEQAWEIVSESYKARFAIEGNHVTHFNPLYKFFSGIVLQAWEARASVLRQRGEPFWVPDIISDIQKRTANTSQEQDPYQPGNSMGLSLDNLDIPMQMEFEPSGLFYGMSLQGLHGEPAINLQASMLGQPSINPDDTERGWAEKGWDLNGASM